MRRESKKENETQQKPNFCSEDVKSSISIILIFLHALHSNLFNGLILGSLSWGRAKFGSLDAGGVGTKSPLRTLLLPPWLCFSEFDILSY